MNFIKLDEGLCVNTKINQFAWVDIVNRKFYKSDDKESFLDEYNYPAIPSNIFKFDKDRAIVLDDNGISDFVFSDGSVNNFFSYPRNFIPNDFRGNDGVMISGDQFLFGVMHKSNPKKFCGAVWLLDKKRLIKVQENHIPNSFIKIDDFILISDSLKNTVYKFSLDEKKIIGIWRKFNSNDGIPDGGFYLDGYCYFAMWGKSKVIKLDKNGNYISELLLKELYPTNCKNYKNKILITFATRNSKRNEYLINRLNKKLILEKIF